MTSEPWILTHSGRRVSLANPRPEDICLEDIAHHLARTGRFAGAGDHFLSVAQHCVHVSELAPWDLQRWALLHDASEAYIGDQSSPLKALLRTCGGGDCGGRSSLDVIEARFHRAISTRFNVPIVNVKRYDIISMLTERRDNGPRGCDDSDWTRGYIDDTLPIPRADYDIVQPWTPARAEWVFLHRAEQLGLK